MNTLNQNIAYGQAIVEHKWIRYAVMAIAISAFAGNVLMIELLNVAWSDVGYGLLIGIAISTLMGLGLGLYMATSNIDFDSMQTDKIMLVLSVVPTILGLGLMAGFMVAALIIITPMLVTMPASFALRSYVLRRYAQS